MDPQATSPQSPPKPDDGMDEGEPQIITVTGVDLSTLPFTTEQVKEAVYQLEIMIRMDDLPDGLMPADQEAIL